MTASDETPSTAESFVHPAYFYRGDEEYLHGTVGFIREGLAHGEPVAVSVPTANLELIRAALGADADAVHLLDMTVEGRNPARIIPGVLRAFADAHPGTRVRIIGEPIWADRSPLEYPACVQHEALINAAFAGRAVTILCPYDLATLSERAIADAFTTHPTVIEDSGETLSGDYDPDRIVAEYNRPLPAPPATAETLAFDTATLATARHSAVAYARRGGMSEERVTDLELIVGEATTNSVLHGGGQGVLAFWIEESQFCCQIQDSGHITNPLAGRLPAPLRRPGGRGLLLINQLADLVRLYTTALGTTLRIHLPLAAAA
ncbi:sensor histidine kinase [Nocardia sp. JMUB6875]|uniref:anti-sigma factor RsbA family regulatory protein n=1 Tax=Nocardia sp. JMUB6875 TaxID=3158170 RepID=UPI0032E6E601